MKTPPPFWLVWTPGGRVPRFRHETYQDAVIEARRLTRENPYHEFFVLVPVGRCVKAEVKFDAYVTPEEAAQLDSELAIDAEAGVIGVEAEN